MSDQSFEAAAPSEEVFVDNAQAAPVYSKQGMNVYTVMLLISLLCLIVGAIILFIEAGRFGGWNTDSAKPNSASLTPKVLHVEDSHLV